MKKIILLAALAFAGCAKEGVPTYDASSNYVEFAGKVTDTLTMAFYLHSSDATFDMPLSVLMSGVASSEGRPFKMEVDTEHTTAVRGTHFEMPENPSFTAGAYEARPTVRFMRTADMKEKRFLLVLNLADNQWFHAGQWEHRRIAIWVHDQMSQPEWWDWTVQQNYLGVYSDLKMVAFLNAAGHPDLSAIKGNYNLLRTYALMFKRHLEQAAAAGHPITEADNSTLMTVPVIN